MEAAQAAEAARAAEAAQAAEGAEAAQSAQAAQAEAIVDAQQAASAREARSPPKSRSRSNFAVILRRVGAALWSCFQVLSAYYTSCRRIGRYSPRHGEGWGKKCRS